MSPFSRLNPSKKNYATFNERFSTEEGKEDEVVCGAHVRDVITGEEFDVRAKCVVNATGPFTDAIRKMDDPTERNICQPSSGVHIVLPEYYRYCWLRKQPTFGDTTPWSPREASPEIPYWWHVTTQIKVVFLIGWCKFPTWHDQSEALPSYGYWHVISMKFLHSFLRRHFAGKPLVTSRNVGCFLGLQPPVVQKADSAIFRINLLPLDSVIGFPNILRSLSQVCTWHYLHLDWINLYLNDSYRNDSGSKRPVTRTLVVSIRYDLAQALELLHKNISITSVQ